MKRKVSILHKTRRKRIILFFLVIAIIAPIIIPPTITYAQGLFQFVAEVGVPPYYKVHAQGNTLYVTTNMTLYINNKKVNYR